MIKIIAGGKKHGGEYGWLIHDYQKRCKAPFDFSFEFYEGDKFERFLDKWDFSDEEFVIVCDERGDQLNSVEFAEMCQQMFNSSRKVVIIIGAAFGVPAVIREKADFVWSFSPLVFPHMLSRLIVSEQIYRAQEIIKGGKYHHE